MTKRWLPLDLHGVEDIPSLVQKLLETLPNGDFESHLIFRRVEKIRLGFFLFRAALLVTQNEQGFDIGLSTYHKSSIDDWMIDIGHEIGHTFAWGIELIPPLNDQRQWGEISEWELPDRIRESEEEFCDLFGIAWANSCDGHPGLRKYLEKLGGKHGIIHIQFLDD